MTGVEMGRRRFLRPALERMCRPRRLMFVMRGLAISALMLAVVAACGSEDAKVVADNGRERAEWEQVAELPMEPRTRAVLAWTGSEVLVLGGDRFSCPPPASCVAPEEPPLVDAAALDLETGKWRSLTPPPVPFHSGTVAVVGDTVYVLASLDYGSALELLRYDVRQDAWGRVPPPAPELGWYRLVAAGDRLVAYPGSEEAGVTGDLIFAPASEGWQPLPDDPVSPAFDRTLEWDDPYLYLFDKELVPQPGSEQPSVVRAARLHLADRTWQRLPDSPIIAGGTPWLVTPDALIAPWLGGADGGEVNNWGRTHPNGGILDQQSLTWRPLPNQPAGSDLPGSIPPTAGAFAGSSAVYGSTHGWLLDVDARTWTQVPKLPGTRDPVEIRPIAAGRAAIALFDNAIWRYVPSTFGATATQAT